MSVNKDQICRLCLKVADNEFEEIDEVMNQMFDILFLKVDLKLTKDPIICHNCLEVAKKCLYFKSTCINMEKVILSYCTDKKISKVNIKVIYKERKHVVGALGESLDICRICMARSERNNFALLSTLTNDSMFETSEYLPEMDFNVIEDPIVCADCRENLQCYLKFALNCLDIEEKIKAYCREEGTDSMGQVNLCNMLNFLFKDLLAYSDKGPQKCVIKKELNRYEDTEKVHLVAFNGLIKLKEELDIKEEEINLKENPYKSLLDTRLNKSHDMFPPEIKSDMICFKTKGYINDESAYQKKVQANIMEDSSIHEDILEAKRHNTDIQINKHAVCGPAPDIKGKRNYTNDLISKIDASPSEANTYKNKLHISESKKQRYLKNLKQKNNINEHTVIKKNSLDFKSDCSIDKEVSEITMYQCLTCPYETKHKGFFERHTLGHIRNQANIMEESSIHENILEAKRHNTDIQINKHAVCGPAPDTKEKKNDTNDLISKIDASASTQITVYQCLTCPYETKHKGFFKRHTLGHIRDKNVHMCLLCTYEGKGKGDIERHMKDIHEYASKLKMYKCSFCTYTCKYKSKFEQHTLVHKDYSEIKTHNCPLRTYEGKRKGDLKRHISS